MTLSDRTASATDEFIRAQEALLDHYGVEAESRFIPTPALGGDTHVLAAGKGPPVMMVIGGGMVAGLWAPLLAELDGFTLYALDPPGHGLTAPMAYRKDTMRDLGVAFLVDALDGLGLESPGFIAQSMGGLWTTWLALDRPERVAAISYVACPAMILGTSAPVPLRVSTIRPIRALLNAIDPPSPRQVLRLAKLAGEDLSGLPQLCDLFLAFERLPGTAGNLLDLHRALVRLRGPRPEVELTADHLDRIHHPVQMIWGEGDPYGSPSVAERVRDLVEGAELHVVPGGHGPWFTQSEVIAPLIEGFLGRTHRFRAFH